MAVSFVSAFDQLAEFGREGVIVEEVVNSKTRAGGLPGVRGADALLRGPDATRKVSHVSSSHAEESESIPRPTKLDLLEAIYDLVEVKNELCSI